MQWYRFLKNLFGRSKYLSILLRKRILDRRDSKNLTLKNIDLPMNDLIKAHKKLISSVKRQMGFSDYGMYWLAFIEGGLTIWLLERIFFHWFK